MHELNLIAQDTTDYGYDLGMKDGLAYLLEQIIKTVSGYRLDPHYVCLPRLCDRSSD